MADAQREQRPPAPRYDLGPIAERLRASRVPRGLRGAPHHLAALALFLGGVEALTGALLGLYYRPDPASAHSSVRHVVTDVPFGELFRALHARGADLLIATTWALVLATALTGRHARPRDLSWAALVALAFAALAEGFTGALLPWSRQSVVAAQIATGTVASLPLVGHWLRRVMLGDDAAGAVTLVRVWGFHAGVVPAAVTALLALIGLHHAALRAPEPEEGIPLAPHFALRASALCTAALMALTLLAALAPPTLGPAAEPGVSAGEAHPPWYLLAPHAALAWTPARLLGVPGGTIVAVGGAALALLLFALPLVDPAGSRRARAVVALFALALLGVMVHARIG